MGHFADQQEMGVDPGATVAEFRGHFHRLGDVPGPDGGGQAVLRVIRPADRLFRGFEFGDGDHRAEHFLLNHFVLLPGSGEQGGFEVETFATGGGSPGHGFDMLGVAGAGHKALHPFELGGGHGGADVILFILGLVVADGFHRFAEFANQIVVNLGSGVDPAGGGAVLAPVVVAELFQGGDNFLHVGVVKNDDGGLAAQFEVGAFESCGGGGDHLGAGRDTAGEGDHADQGVGDQGLTRHGSAAGHDVGDTGGKEVGEDSAEVQSGKGGEFRGLQDDGVAGREGGGEFPSRHLQREVPRGNGADHAHGVAAEHGGVAGHVLAGGGTGEAAGGPGVETEAVADGGHLVGHEDGPRFAGVKAFKITKGFRLLVDGVGNFQ